MNQSERDALIAAYWLLGVAGGFRERGFPSWLERREFFSHEATAYEISFGGTFRGPIPICELIAYVGALSKRLSPFIDLRRTASTEAIAELREMAERGQL